MEHDVVRLARLLDLSAVRAESDEAEVLEMARAALRFRPAAVFSLPGFTPLLVRLLGGEPSVAIGGVVGFPSGGVTTATKAAEARELRRMGCGELDMVINIGKLRSGRDGEVLDDIRAVVDAAGGAPVKVILECHHLTEDRMRAGCDLAVTAGAAFVKTGTGWAPTGATPRNVAVLHDQARGRIAVKAAGGVRTLETLTGLHRAGARRFGIGTSSAVAILEACAARPGGVVDLDG